MNLEQFCKLPSEITPQQAQELNKDLSTKTLADIPEEFRSEVEGYLCTQLNCNGVQPDLIESLDGLVKELQEIE